MTLNISVIIPVFCAEKYVTRAIESALQFREVKEIILIEDGSPDKALQVCIQQEKQHDRVRLFQHPDKSNHGAGASRNYGLAKAKCEYVAFLDADDYYLPNRFDADKKVFFTTPNADGVYNAIGTHFYSSADKSQFRKSDINEITTVTDVVDSKTLFESFIWLQTNCGYFHLNGLTIKKKAISSFDYFFNPDLRLHQDSEFIYRLSYFANLVPGELDKPTANRGIHGQNRIIYIQTQKNKTKVKQRKLLWSSLYKWAKKNQIPQQYIKQIRRIVILKTILSSNYFISWILFIYYSIIDKQILIKPPFYKRIHYFLFGKNKISVILLRVKKAVFHA